MIAFDRVAQYITSVGTDEVMSLGAAVPTYLTAAAAAADRIQVTAQDQPRRRSALRISPGRIFAQAQ